MATATACTYSVIDLNTRHFHVADREDRTAPNALKLALYESVQNLAKQKTIAGIPLAAAGAAAGLPAGAATSGAAASTAMAAAMAAVSSSQGTLTSASETQA